MVRPAHLEEVEEQAVVLLQIAHVPVTNKGQCLVLDCWSCSCASLACALQVVMAKFSSVRFFIGLFLPNPELD